MSKQTSTNERKRKKRDSKSYVVDSKKLWSGLEMCTYYFQDGLRLVRPHTYTHSTFAKGRWLNRAILEVLVDEFVAYSPLYYAEALKKGRICINGGRVDENYILRSNDLLEHTVHRHELPVTNMKIKFTIAQTLNIVYVDKPSSIPIHPSGKYHFNSLVYILAKEKGLQLYPVHRLDRLTSGLCIFATNSKTASQLSKRMRERSFRKFYLAKVQGNFPECDPNNYELEDLEIPVVVKSLQDESGARSTSFKVSESIVALSKRLGKYGVLEQGDVSVKYVEKECETVFRKIHFDGNHSVVLCQPLTGRTHQIRVHLQWLGYPIANDPCYGGNCFLSPTFPDVHRILDTAFVKDPDCWDCNLTNKDPLKYDPSKYCSQIWLHALRYSISSSDSMEGFDFFTDVPTWANKENLE